MATPFFLLLLVLRFYGGKAEFSEPVCEANAEGKCEGVAAPGDASASGNGFLFARNGDYENTTLLDVDSAKVNDIDQLLELACTALKIESAAEACAPGSGARLVDSRGSRVTSVLDVVEGKHHEPIYVVPRWLHFIWPTVKVGHEVFPTNVKSADPKNPMSLVTLSMRPRVFKIKNFMTLAEVEEIIEKNKPRLKRSTVGATASFDKTRTSTNTWDLHSRISKRFKKRAFDMLGMDHVLDQEDGLQILNYQPGQYYKPHVDWLNPALEDMEGNLYPKIDNGTNRFATVFFYMNTVPEGGHTVFPRSYSHSYFDGNKVMRDGPKNPPPGYISDRDAAWACNTSSSALRSDAVSGEAVLFYNQLEDGTLDHESLHGGCPVIEGEKWAANLWIWNRPRSGSFRIKKGRKQRKPDKIVDGKVKFHIQNGAGVDIDVHWVNPQKELHNMGTVKPGEFLTLNSFVGHKFAITNPGDSNMADAWSFVDVTEKLHEGVERIAPKES
eukprot:CAMPEP_0197536162 /NCGR_PEP_ID=MMETSP1318-20131121/53122_1 /TAXON_ID=552666 /ORGANISM="Partenskyella glossopodia, Strain RCC365" /LENGTH=497 /DNA_ID=CAMNT_0043093969 /DNA_START=64 /DNA_END=1557 /DNA_ORIENTATION=-